MALTVYHVCPLPAADSGTEGSPRALRRTDLQHCPHADYRARRRRRRRALPARPDGGCPRRRDHRHRQHRRRHHPVRPAGLPGPGHGHVHPRRRHQRGAGLGPGGRDVHASATSSPPTARARRGSRSATATSRRTSCAPSCSPRASRCPRSPACCASAGSRASGCCRCPTTRVETHVVTVEDAADPLPGVVGPAARRRPRRRRSSRSAPRTRRPRPACSRRSPARTSCSSRRPTRWSSIGPILAVPGIRDAVEAQTVVGVSGIIGGAPVRGMADACLAAIGVETSAAAVAAHYGAGPASTAGWSTSRTRRPPTTRRWPASRSARCRCTCATCPRPAAIAQAAIDLARGAERDDAPGAGQHRSAHFRRRRDTGDRVGRRPGRG